MVNNLNPIGGRAGVELIGSLGQVNKAQKSVARPQEPVAKAPPKAAGGPGNGTRLQFRVDDKTKDVTILIVDKDTDKIIRTIPPEAIKDLPAGELLQYST